jgi:hypothetical protein
MQVRIAFANRDVNDAYALTHALLQYCIKKACRCLTERIQSIEYKRNMYLETEDGIASKQKILSTQQVMKW